MYTEELIEEGIVTEISNGVALISISESSFCEECTAKIFCHTENNIKSVAAKDLVGVKAGDIVQISIRGKKLVAASIILYFIPLLFLVGGIIIGMNLFQNHSEILSAVIGFFLLGSYLIVLRLVLKTNWAKNRFLPTIISINTTK